jgi:Sulfotransferase family
MWPRVRYASAIVRRIPDALTRNPTPLFVLGRHRSGTTWLANALASLPEVYAPEHVAPRRIHESAFFSHLVRHCNHGRCESDLREIKRLFEASRYFALTGQAQGPDILRLGPAGYFRAVMEAGARRKGARYWLEKTPAHTLHSKFLSEAFPDAVFVAVQRDYRDVVASNVHGFGAPASAWNWFRHSVATAAYEKVIARRPAIVVRYEDLLADFGGTMQGLMTALGIPGPVPPVATERNSSFADVPPAFTARQRLAMSAGRGLVRLLPSAVLERAVVAWRARTPAALPAWFPAYAGDAPAVAERKP